MSISISAINYFIPIFAFLLVFIVIYALLKKTGILGGNEPVMLFVSLILASFFVIETSLIEIVKFSSAWISVLVIAVFFLILIIGFLPWKEPFDFLTKGSWFSWVVLALIIVIFIVTSGYVFHWAITWGEVTTWVGTEWFGMILLLVIAAVVAFIIKGKK